MSLNHKVLELGNLQKRHASEKKSAINKSLLFAYYDIDENGPLYQNGNRYTVKDIVFVPNKTRKEIKFTQNITIFRYFISFS